MTKEQELFREEIQGIQDYGVNTSLSKISKKVKTNEIRAVYTESTIRVYQAYNKVIADEAVRIGTFGSNFKRK